MQINFGIFIVIIGIVAFIAYLIGKAVMKVRLTQDHTVIRKDAIMRSRAVLTGQISEQLAPFLPDFRWSPTQVRFIGKPIDFLVFEGMDDKNISNVVFVEVKTGKSNLSMVEKSLKDAIKNKRVTWEEYRITTK